MDTQDTSPSVLLFFDKQRFIFNAGEVSVMIITVIAFVSRCSLTCIVIEFVGFATFLYRT